MTAAASPCAEPRLTGWCDRIRVKGKLNKTNKEITGLDKIKNIDFYLMWTGKGMHVYTILDEDEK